MLRGFDAVMGNISQSYEIIIVRYCLKQNTESYAEAMKKACEQEARLQELEESRKTYQKILEEEAELKERIAVLDKNRLFASKFCHGKTVINLYIL